MSTDGLGQAISERESRRIEAHPVLGPLLPASTVSLSVDGRPVSARAGEPIIAALLAAGIRVLRTMPQSGEKRGGYCMVGRCADCLMTVDGELNVRTCVTAVRDGMRIVTQRGLGTWEQPERSSADQLDATETSSQ